MSLRNRSYNGYALSISALLLVITLSLLWWRVSFYLSSAVAVGKVVRLNTSSGYHADVRFTTREGETITVSTGPGHPVNVGDRLEIRYIPSDPRADATLDQFGSFWGADTHIRHPDDLRAFGRDFQSEDHAKGTLTRC